MPRKSRALPANLLRIERVISPENIACPRGCGDMVRIGEDRSERLDILPAQYRVIVTIRTKYACPKGLAKVAQARTAAKIAAGGLDRPLAPHVRAGVKLTRGFIWVQYHRPNNNEITRDLGNGSPTDGFLDYAYAAAQDWRIIPTIQMAASPSGMVTDAAIEHFNQHFFAMLERKCLNIDGIFLVLHGAMISETRDDVEGALLREIRQRLEACNLSIPVAAVIDLHANATRDMTDFSTCLYSYRKNPHSDTRSCGAPRDIVRQTDARCAGQPAPPGHALCHPADRAWHRRRPDEGGSGACARNRGR